LGSEVRKLKHERHSLETQDQALDGKKHHLLAEDKTLSVKDKNLRATERLLTAKDRKLALKGKGLALKNKALAKDGKVLARKDRALKLKGKGLTQKDKLLSLKGKILAHDNKELAQQGKDLENKVPLQSKIPLGHGPVVHPKPEILTREYVEFDEMFERALGDVESGSSTVPRPSHFRIGTEVLPHRGVPRRGLGVPRRGLGVPRRGPFSSPFGHGPVEFPHHRSPIIGHGGPYYGPRPEIPSEPKLVTREYAEFDDMFERDLEDIEFDARDFDALYLD
jgi:microtubule-associated protein 1